MHMYSLARLHFQVHFITEQSAGNSPFFCEQGIPYIGHIIVSNLCFPLVVHSILSYVLVNVNNIIQLCLVC